MFVVQKLFGFVVCHRGLSSERMAANRGTRDRRVFVGNIPYDATEEQLIEVFREAGPVAAFRFFLFIPF